MNLASSVPLYLGPMAEKTGDGGIYPKHGGFGEAADYQVAELLYDITVRFTKRYIEPAAAPATRWNRRARGSRNIAEGSVFSATSKKVEMNLTNVARASSTELKKDYASFLPPEQAGTMAHRPSHPAGTDDRRFQDGR